MPSILYGSEVHPISETMVILTNKVAKLTARAYYKENVADTLRFLGCLPARKLEKYKLLNFAARMLESSVDLLRNTAHISLSIHPHLPWCKRVHDALHYDSYSPIRNLFNNALHNLQSDPPTSFKHQLSRHWRKLKPTPHCAFLHAPLSCTITFRFWRGHLDPYRGETDDERDGICVFCNLEKETTQHILNCPANPFLPEIMKLPTLARDWLLNPTMSTELSSEEIAHLSGIHRKVWIERSKIRKVLNI